MKPVISSVTVRPTPLELRRDHLRLQGEAPDGRTLGANSHYLERNGQPYLPVIGEFHFARYRAAGWERELAKIKAGGVDTVATCVFWILHEPRPGVWDWTGDFNLRRFALGCARLRLQLLLRIGPFGHGEMRNGGLPDWLYGQAFEVRSDAPGYLAYVERWYEEVSRQVAGLLFKDGGPVVGVQLENEYQHAGAPWEISYAGAAREWTVPERDRRYTFNQITVHSGTNPHQEAGRQHLAKLQEIARRVGLDVPWFTATGWGNAAIAPRDCLPVGAGYAYPFWAPPVPSPFYLYRDLKRRPDYPPVSYDPALYPCLPAELGPGIVPVLHRRPTVPPESVLPMIVRTVGSGANGVGYYMYHGGSTPLRNGRSLNEHSGGLPRINYDFQAPLGEHGQRRPHYRELRLLHHLLRDFAGELAPTAVFLPDDADGLDPMDTESLRWAVRWGERGGFVFLHNYQDHVPVVEVSRRCLHIEVPAETIRLPARDALTLPPGGSAVLPIGMQFGATRLRTATVQPLARLEVGGRSHLIAFPPSGFPVEVVLAGDAPVTCERACRLEPDPTGVVVLGRVEEVVQFRTPDLSVLVVPRTLALGVVRLGDGQLVSSSADVVPAVTPDGLTVLMEETETVLHFFPAVRVAAHGSARLDDLAPVFPGGTSVRVAISPVTVRVETEWREPRRLVVRLPDDWPGVAEAYLRITYIGDRAMAFIDGELVADHFYHGPVWELGLSRFVDRLRQHELVILFHPMAADAPYLSDLAPPHRPSVEIGAGGYLRVGEVKVVVEHAVELRWSPRL